MGRVKNISGGGANTNKNGLQFEQDTDLKKAFEESEFDVKRMPPIIINKKTDKSYKVYSISKGDKLFGYVMQKHNLYRHFGLNEYEDAVNKIAKWQKLISRQLLPDDVFYNVNEKTLYIIEKKFQSGPGSVDEKLQTFGFKLYEYNKLFKAETGIKNIKYYYLLSNFYNDVKYKDILEYIKKDEKCGYYFEQLPLSAIGIKEELNE